MIDLKTQYKDYLALLTLLAFGLLGFLYFDYDRQFQNAVVVITALGYIVWGVIHHRLRGDFHLKVFVEYCMVAFLGTILVLVLLERV